MSRSFPECWGSQSSPNDECPNILEWANPHVYIYLREENADGSSEVWEIEGFPPAFMRRAGWSKKTLTPGDSISLATFAARDSSQALAMLSPQQSAQGLLREVRSYMQAVTDTTATGVARSLAGTWAGVRNSDAIDVETWPLTQRTKEQISTFVERESPAARCIPPTAPMKMTFPDFKHIEVNEETVVISAEFDNVRRVVQMQRLEDSPPPSWQGYSVGRWDNDVLIVETSGFLEHRTGNGFALPSGEGKRLIERFSISEDGESLYYEFELTDPVYLIEPVSRSMLWVYRPDVTYQANECDMEVAKRFLRD
jgi:hypothetical protein